MTDIFELPASMLAYICVVAFIFGTCMGSFLNCAAYRVVRGESFVKGKSHCPKCGHELGIKDLIPLLSWLFSKGKCRYCGEPVSVRYPLTELAFGIITLMCVLRFGLTVLCLRNFIFLAVLFMLTLTDIDDMIIPDGCHIAALIAWIAAEPFITDGWKSSLGHVASGLLFGAALLGISLLLDRMLGKESLGGGDIKLIAVCGLYLGAIGTLFTLMLSCITGLIYSVIHNAKVESGKGKAFPFGPWIALSCAIMLLYGDPLINWYRDLLI